VVVLSAFLFKEKITVKKIVCLCVAFLGCAFVTGILNEGGSDLSWQGILVGLGAGLGYALYSIFGRYAIERGYSTFTISFYTFLFSSIGTLPLVKLGHIREVIVESDGMKCVLLLLGFALISTVLPYLLYTIGLTQVENGKASIMASIEPVVATLLGIFVYGENLTVQGTIGILLVLGAIVFLNMNEKSNETDCSEK
jgi:drug/metabolite transporter, DME family